MPAKVTLKITKGALTGKEFVFDERATCIVGRASDCNPQLPNDEGHRTVSRHHCLLDINPPDVRLRDFGSLNGTHLNGVMIGQRGKGMTPEEGQKLQYSDHDLKQGDEISLGKAESLFRVDISVPYLCCECSVEVSPSEIVTGGGPPLCKPCRSKRELAGRKEPPKEKAKVCAKCGKDVSAEIGDNRQGDFVCVSCQADPFEILKLLLELANAGDDSLVAIQGYTVLKELGRGGMGAVYLARNDKNGEQVALKVMLPRVAADARSKEMFLRETENTKALKHPQVVELRDAGCANGTFFFALEFCDGGCVDDLMKRRGGKLPLKEAAPLVLQALDGLEYAHHAEIPYVKLEGGRIGQGRGLVHRDLKPQNLFLSGSGRAQTVKVGDFGLSKAFDMAGLSGQTATGSAAGTPLFMPRQQVRNFKYAKPDVDVWAMAASLYNMLTGAFPRDFPSGADPWMTVLQTKPVPIGQRDPSLPRKVAEVIDLALSDESDLHFKSAIDFKRALEKVL